ncbi:MAG: cell envelope integrity protein TolA [Deltaproteobacteria bacterium]|nr:cell envelope integrity protein TolA [Deltaproteobacteria bacterium]
MRWWVCFSGVLHLVLLAMLLLVPPSTALRDAPPPVYTVDLVAPGPAPVAKAAPALAPAVPEPPEPAAAPREVEAPPKELVKEAPEPKEEEPPALTEPVPPEKPKKKVAKPKKKPAPKPKVVKREKPAPKKTAAKKASKKKVSKKRPAKKTPKLAKKAPKRKSAANPDSKLVERLRKRRIDDAVAVARERARLRRAERQAGGGAVGAGTGASGNGGVVRGMAFLSYRQEMLNRIKDRWTWIGKRGKLEVTVGFGVGVDGEIFGLKLLRFSGDSSFDESVVRAVRRSSPLPPPPASHVRDFAQVEITFRPADLDG